jgi:hypothetical protein
MKRVNPKSLENLQPKYAPDSPGETITLGVRLRKDQRDKLNEISTARRLAIGVLIRAAVDTYLSQLAGASKGNMEPSPPPASPPLVDVDMVAQGIAEVIRMPYVSADARRKLKLLLETLSQSQGHLPLG